MCFSVANRHKIKKYSHLLHVEAFWRNFFRMMDVTACTADDESEFLLIISNLTQDQTEWCQRYDEYCRTAKRVSVKSTIVGNHHCSVSRGWTWAQLIDDGKALLAVVEEDDIRIISTD